MEAFLTAIAKSLPEMIVQHGAILVWALLSTAGNVYQWLDQRKRDRETAAEIRRLNELVNTEIRNGTGLAERITDKFATAAEAYRDAIAARRAR